MDEEYSLQGNIEVLNKDHVPFGHKFTRDTTSVIEALKYWIDNRGLPDSRPDRTDLYKYCDVQNSRELMVGSYGLNLSDHYWICKEDNYLNWQDINFFQNNFAVLYDKLIAENKEIYKVHPDFSVNGSLPKAWYINGNDKRILIKKGRIIQEQEPFNEIAASKIMDLLNIDHIHYNLDRIQGDIPVSTCECMVSAEIELVPAAAVINMEERKGRNNYTLINEICKSNGIKNSRECLDKMIFIDYIIGNNDRHLYNFGILRDSATLEWKKVAPIFDNGNSLFFDYQIISKDEEMIDSKCRWFPESNFDKLKLMSFTEWYDAGKMTNIGSIVNKELQGNAKILPEKTDMIIEIINERIMRFEQVINEKRG